MDSLRPLVARVRFFFKVTPRFLLIYYNVMFSFCDACEEVEEKTVRPVHRVPPVAVQITPPF